MRSERRHELQRNDLLDKLSEYYEKIGPYTNVILAVVLVLAVLVSGWRWYTFQNDANLATGWDELDSAMDGEDPLGELEDLAKADDYSGTVVGESAALTAADLRLAQGLNQLFTDRGLARIELDLAVEDYEMVIDSGRDHVREQAHFGLARANEGLLGAFLYEKEKNSLEKGGLGASEVQAKLDSLTGKFRDSAIESYQAIVDEWPDGAFAVLAKRRIEALQSPSSKEFYDAFATFDPKAATADPFGMGGDGASFDFNSLMEGSDPGSVFSGIGDGQPDDTETAPDKGPPVPLSETPVEETPIAEPEQTAPTTDTP